MRNRNDEMSPGGSAIVLHEPPTDFTPARGQSSIGEISTHIEHHLGPIANVFHELISDAVHLDVHVVMPTADCPNIRLVTSGMSDLPMTLGEGVEASPYLELMLTLPADWPLQQEQLQDERNYWPIRLLKTLARFPHKYGTWLGLGHTVPNGDPAEPYAPGVGFDGAILLLALSAPDAFDELQVSDGRTIEFLSVVPLYPEEMALKLSHGTDALIDLLSDNDIGDVIEPGRSNPAVAVF
ncbi:ankyrin [Stenotrophomonas humi]|uniref:Ankyrin n=1 Tax=Stenotrophomonas humi TaxID=405444 RepID=A0A0R0C197_9GAMM|nr:suppressor of fused domain protein [Stenotrophomonas humi]KRG63179.1 ankyrin [Stenotrophomonas humi]